MNKQILAMTAGCFLLGAWFSYSHVLAAAKTEPAKTQACDGHGPGNASGPTSRPDGKRPPPPPPPPPGGGNGDDGGPPPPPPPPPPGQ